jgi:hypothetical protein
MAPRANWKGFLRLSLVTCPVGFYERKKSGMSPDLALTATSISGSGILYVLRSSRAQWQPGLVSSRGACMSALLDLDPSRTCLVRNQPSDGVFFGPTRARPWGGLARLFILFVESKRH